MGKFKCSNGTCLDINVRCNTRQDCSDGSDELNCGKQHSEYFVMDFEHWTNKNKPTLMFVNYITGDDIKVENCSLSDGKFLCYDKLRCLDLEYACNQECNCFDCSDENENCTLKYSTNTIFT